MDDKTLTYQEKRIEHFLQISTHWPCREYVMMQAVMAVTEKVVPFAEHGNLEYKSVKEGDCWGHDWCSCWMKISAAVPEEFAGKELCIQLNIGGEALFFDKNGQPLYALTGHCVFDHLFCKDRLVLGKFAAGETIEFDVEGAGSGLDGCALPNPDDPDKSYSGFGRASRKINRLRLCVFDRAVWKMLLQIKTLFAVVQSYGLADYRAKRLMVILSEALDIFNHDFDNAAATSEFLQQKAFSFGAASTALQATAVGHAHIDVGWLWPVAESIRKSARTFASQIKMLETYPEYVFGASQPALYKMVKEHYPELYEKIKKFIANGRWEVQGGMFVEADCNLTSGESLVRQFLHGKNFFRDEFGVEVKNLWLPDVFGYSGNLPQIISKAGCDYFLTVKLSWNEFNKIPYHTFRWIGVDGSTVLAHFPPENTYNATTLPDQRIPAQNRFSEIGIVDEYLSVYGVGDGGGGPYEDYIESNLLQSDLDGCPKVKMGRADEFFDRMKPYMEKLPQWRGEFYFERHRGTLTSQSRTKRGNRQCEQKLTALEYLLSQGDIQDYPAEKMDELWKLLLTNQFHDILPGSSIAEVYETAEKDYQYILDEVQRLSAEFAGKNLALYPGAVTLINTLSSIWQGTLELSGAYQFCRLSDEAGNAVPGQVENGRVWIAPNLSGGSFTALVPTPGNMETAEEYDDLILENDLVKYTFAENGQLLSCFDKELQCEMLSAPGNVLTFYNDRPLMHEAWDVDMDYLNRVRGIWQGKVAKSGWHGPVRSVLYFVYDNGQSVLEQEVVLRFNSKRLDFITQVDWHEERTMLRSAFPTAIYSSSANYDIQYSFLSRSTGSNTSYEQAQFECCGQRYADLWSESGGVALLNDCKYGYRIKENVIDLGLLRSARFPDMTADMGKHFFTYSLLPHSERLTASCVMQEAAALNRAPWLFYDRTGSGIEPVCRIVQGDGVTLEVIKKAEKSDDRILRIVENCNRHATAVLELPCDDLILEETDLMEWNTAAEYPIRERHAKITMKPFEIKTFILKGLN